jgi:hypothetical protein
MERKLVPSSEDIERIRSWLSNQIGLTQLPTAFLLELEAVACESPYSAA